jgi:hypothetical protein
MRPTSHSSRVALAVVALAAGVGAWAGLASMTAAAPVPATATTPTPPTPPAGAGAVSATPSPLIYPSETIPIRFDHARHAKLGATCEGCHVAALSSMSAADNLIPPEAACRGCHKIDRDAPVKVVPAGQGPARCDACHVDDGGTGWMPGPTPSATPSPSPVPPRVVLSRPALKFGHRIHVARGIACTTCHAGADGQAMVTRADLPMMASCLGCHDGKQASARCTACHLAEADGRVKVRLATSATAAIGGTGPLVPSGALRGLDAHGPNFRKDHAAAGRDEGYCLSCHRRNDCVDCHGGVVKPPDIHPSDYVSLHGTDARRNTPDCSSCHRTQTFCVGCHQRLGVASDPEGGLPGRRPNNPFGTGTQLKQFHPPGWARDAGGEVLSNPRPTSHSVQAKRNIRTCASCHREESCLACHSTDPSRGPTFSPHPPNFGATARCRFLAARNRRACIKCHAPTAAELDCQ